jgi:Tfp pilus tip-associated adhesin PilY1
VLVEFGTGQRTQLTNMAPVTWASGTQSLYGVWDWNLTQLERAWHRPSPTKASRRRPSAFSSPYTADERELGRLRP